MGEKTKNSRLADWLVGLSGIGSCGGVGFSPAWHLGIHKIYEKNRKVKKMRKEGGEKEGSLNMGGG